MFWGDLENLVVDAFGVVETSGLVLPDGQGECFFDGVLLLGHVLFLVWLPPP